MTTRTIDLGKIAYHGTRKINRVTIDVRLKDGQLSISGTIWNGRGTDCISCGQNIDEIAKLFPLNGQVRRIAEIWRKWHLNHTIPGSPRQMEFVREYNRVNEGDYSKTNYHALCKALHGADLLQDAEYLHNGKPYAYGSAWLRQELPADVLVEIEGWFV